MKDIGYTGLKLPLAGIHLTKKLTDDFKKFNN